MQKAFLKYNVDFQLVPPYTHRRNASECAIRTFKNYLCAGLASCDANFPSQEWDRLIPQDVITLNLLRSSRKKTSLSAHTDINGNFDFNATPLAPPGTKVLVHEAASNRPSFSTHAVDGWYIGPYLNHYRCYHCYISTNASTRHSDTVEFFPKHFNLPKVTNSTYLRQAAEDIISILSDKKAISSHPSLYFGSPIYNSYLQVVHILRLSDQTPPTPPLYLLLNIGKLPSSLLRVRTPSLPRFNPLPLPRVPASPPNCYPTRHTRHNQPRPVFATAAAVIDTVTGAKFSLHTLQAGADKAAW